MSGISRSYFITKSIYSYSVNVIRGNLSNIYQRNYQDYYERINNLDPDPPYRETKTHDSLNTTGLKGKMNPLTYSSDWEYQLFNRYVPLPETYVYSGDSIRTSGELAICTDEFTVTNLNVTGYY